MGLYLLFFAIVFVNLGLNKVWQLHLDHEGVIVDIVEVLVVLGT